MASWRRITGAAGLVAGAAAAGAGALVAAERIAVARIRGRGDPESGERFGELRGRPLTVLTQDGVPLHVEINGPSAAPLTVVFCHGYTLNQDCWHFQRRDLSTHRLAFWDQRDHGRSGRSESGAASIDQLGADLKAVIDAVAPGDAQVVLVGHSMGGMTIMALAQQHPEPVRDQGGRGGAHQHRRARPGGRQPVDAGPDPAGAEPGAARRAQRRGQGQARHPGGAQPPR